MGNLQNNQVRLASRPVGIPQANHFKIYQESVKQPTRGQVLVRNIYLSVDLGMRGWVNAAGNYSDPVRIDEVMRAYCSGVVVVSEDSGYDVGDWVVGMFGWQEYVTIDSSQIQRKIDPTGPPLSTSLGVLGLAGLTAYFGLLDCGQPQPGETVVVSTAAGAVGSAVGQIAKIHGCRTVGITGGADKTAQCLEQFGYDACIDYKDGGDLQEKLAHACPAGVDIYFDNTSGAISDAVMQRLNLYSRIIINGTTSINSWEPTPVGPRVERSLLVNRARMQGILVLDYINHFDKGIKALSRWLQSGELVYAEEILDGIEQAPDAIAGLYRGDNHGRRLIRLADTPR